MRKFFSVAALLLSSQLYGQDSTKALSEIVVTATKTNRKQSQTGKVVTVIDSATLSNNLGRTVSELLNTQAGIFINGANNNLGTNKDIYFRGAGAGNVLIVVDGVAVYDPSQISNSFDINSIPLGQVERIEILKGGQSTLWGSDAVAGVIQIFLKKKTDRKIAGNAQLSYGSYHTVTATAGVAGRIQQLDYNVQYSYLNSKGFSSAYDSTNSKKFDNDGFVQNSVRADLTYHVSNSFSVRAFGNTGDYKNDLDAGAFTDDKDYTAKNKNSLGGIWLKYGERNFTWNVVGSYQATDRSFLNDSTNISNPYVNYARGNYVGHTTTLETFGNAHLSQHIDLVAGVQYLNQNTIQSYVSSGPYGKFETGLGKDSTKNKQASVYASLLVTDVHGFNFELGGRYNNNSLYGDKMTYTINPSFTIDDNTKVFFNVSSAYKIPSLYQLHSEYGNKQLKPEASVTYEGGVQTQSDDKKISFRLVGFKRDIKNLIIFYSDPVTYAGQYVNRDEQHDYGVEVENSIRLSTVGSWSNSLSFVQGAGMENNVKMENLYRRPKFTFVSGITLRPFANFTVAPTFRYVGTRLKSPYDAGPDEQPAYYTLDVFTGYTIKQARLFIDFRNITNQQYFDIVGYTGKRFNLTAGVAINL